LKQSETTPLRGETRAASRLARPETRGVIVLPTFNEALNLPHLVPRLLEQPDVDILIVDDGSPDGTGDLAERLAQEHAPRVSVIHRTTKSGRGGAVMAGFQAALNRDYTWFGEMDADQSHQPEELPALRDALQNADMVVGARYLPGGEIHGWPRRRRIWSRTSNAIIRGALGVPMRDFTNGYRLYSRRAVEVLTSAKLRETGYITLSEWAYTIHRAGLTISEVPTVFINRRLGESNMSASEAVGALRALARMRVPPRRSS